MPNILNPITGRAYTNPVTGASISSPVPGGSNAANLTGGPTQAGKGAYGAVPTIPSPIATAGQAIGGDIGNLAGLYGLSTGTSGASAAGAATQYGANLPLFGPMTQAGSQNILNNLQGIVSPDVTNQLAQMAAQRGVGFGAGAPNTNAALLSALGQTSMGLQNLGQQQLTSAIGRTPVGPAFNPNQFLVTPGEQQGAQTAANIFAAAPNPAAAANAGLKQAQQGLNTGLGLGGTGGFAGGGGLRDALGFPISQDTGYGGGGPGMIAGGALGTPSTPNDNLAGWNQWWNTGTQGAMTTPGGSQPSWMEQYGAGTPVGTLETPGGEQSYIDPFGGYGGQYADAYSQGQGQGFQTGMASDQGYGSDFFGGGDIFSDIGG